MRQQGGSVASTSVTGLVNSESYGTLNKQFTNILPSAQCGGRCGCKGGCVNCKKTGGTAPAFDYTLPRSTKGGNMKSMHELMSQNSGHSYSLKHQSGGFASTTDDIGLKYNSSIKAASIPYGNASKFSNSPTVVNQYLANESVGAMPTLNKTISYGSVADDSAFNYAATLKGAGIRTVIKDGFKNVVDKAKSLVKKAKRTLKPSSSTRSATAKPTKSASAKSASVKSASVKSSKLVKSASAKSAKSSTKSTSVKSASAKSSVKSSSRTPSATKSASANKKKKSAKTA